MEQQIVTKVTRFLELSKQFSKTEDELFGSNPTLNSYFVGNCGLECNSSGYVRETSSKSEIILAKAKKEAQKADEFDEYKKLQTELTEYFNALNKIIK